MDLAARAMRLQELHHGPRMLVLPNAWDVASARIFELEGFDAVATTSAGIAWSLGHADGGRITLDEVLWVLGHIVRHIGVPVTADIEDGYGDTSKAVAETVRRVLQTGAAGINLEDAPGPLGAPLTDIATHARKVAAARVAAQSEGVPLVINARTDVFWGQVGEPQTRLEEAVRRLNAYREHGADCLFVPGVRDRQIIAELVSRIGGPLNVLAGPGSPSVEELERLGVARVSVGSGLARTVLARVRDAAQELRRSGTYGVMGDAIPYAEAQSVFSAP